MKKHFNILFVTLATVLTVNFYFFQSNSSKAETVTYDQATVSDFELNPCEGTIDDLHHGSTPENRENDENETEKKEDEASKWLIQVHFQYELPVTEKHLSPGNQFGHSRIAHVPIYILQHSWKIFMS